MRWFCHLLLSLAFLLPCSSWAAPVLILEQNKDTYPVGLYLDFFEDRAQTLTIEDISSLSTPPHFTPSDAQIPNLGFSESAWWGRFTVRNDSSRKSWFLHLDYPLMDLVEFYLPDHKKGFEVKRGGRAMPFHSREFARRDDLFRLPLEAGEEKTFYVRVASESAVSLPLSVWAADAFVAADQTENLMLGLFYGIVVVMVLYNLFLYISLQDRTYLFYVLYAFVFGLDLFIVDGLALRYFWPDLPEWNRKADLFFGFLSVFWAVAFSRRFLATRTITPVVDRLLAALQWFSGFVAVPLLFVSYYHSVKVLIALAAIYVPALLGSALLCKRRGSEGANSFLAAWSWSLAGLLLIVSADLFTFQYLSICLWMAKGCFAMELIFLSFALADRIKGLQADRRRAIEDNLLLIKDNALRQRAEIKKERRFLREKERMIKELHDGVGGATANIHLLAELAKCSAGEEEVRKTLAVISALSRSSIDEIRNFMQSIDARELNWQSLTAEMTSHGYTITEPHGLVFSFTNGAIAADATPPCSLLYFNLLRIFQEALTNIVKHAAARNIAVGMTVEAHTFSLVIQDDGIGFSGGERQGRGLAHMAARAEELGGKFTISLEQGTRLRVDIPIPVIYPDEGMDHGFLSG